ncbi:hypothetical protein Tco_0149033 [Tanacetum coccineum]
MAAATPHLCIALWLTPLPMFLIPCSKLLPLGAILLVKCLETQHSKQTMALVFAPWALWVVVVAVVVVIVAVCKEPHAPTVFLVGRCQLLAVIAMLEYKETSSRLKLHLGHRGYFEEWRCLQLLPKRLSLPFPGLVFLFLPRLAACMSLTSRSGNNPVTAEAQEESTQCQYPGNHVLATYDSDTPLANPDGLKYCGTGWTEVVEMNCPVTGGGVVPG